MHRRLLTILFSIIGLFALSAAASGCSTFSDADAAARVDEAELSPDGLSDLVDALAQGRDPSDGEVVRQTIGLWIQVEVINAGLDEAGAPLTDTQTTEARTQLETQFPGFADLSASTAEMLVRVQATSNASQAVPDFQTLVTEAAEAADVYVDPRFGTFDPVAGSVTPLGGLPTAVAGAPAG
ncbi:MAG: hypothetical protein ABWZ42_01425 [Ilumatobacteraceae bacterium]